MSIYNCQASTIGILSTCKYLWIFLCNPFNLAMHGGRFAADNGNICIDNGSIMSVSMLHDKTIWGEGGRGICTSNRYENMGRGW